jgi:hypothetical protein
MCWDVCLQISACVVLEWSGSVCTTYDTIPSASTSSTGTDQYSKICPCITTTTTTPAFPTLRIPNGPTSLPSGYQAYPNFQVDGGTRIGQMSAVECQTRCEDLITTPDATKGACMGYDYNAAFMTCFIHYSDTICNAILGTPVVYHVKVSGVDCGAGYPAPEYVVP